MQAAISHVCPRRRQSRTTRRCPTSAAVSSLPSRTPPPARALVGQILRANVSFTNPRSFAAEARSLNSGRELSRREGSSTQENGRDCPRRTGRTSHSRAFESTRHCRSEHHAARRTSERTGARHDDPRSRSHLEFLNRVCHCEAPASRRTEPAARLHQRERRRQRVGRRSGRRSVPLCGERSTVDDDLRSVRRDHGRRGRNGSRARQ